MPTKSLLVISEHFYPSTGATAQLVTDLVADLTNYGLLVDVLTATPCTSASDIENINIVRPSSPSTSSTSIFSKIFRGLVFSATSLYLIARKYLAGDLFEILIISNPPFIGLLGLICKYLFRIDYFFVLQDMFPRSAILSGVLPERSPVSVIWRSLLATVCRNSSATIVLSQSMKKRCLSDFLLSPELVHVVPNWAVETGLKLPKTENPIAVSWNVTNNFTIQYSGNFGRLHDILTILEAARILKGENCKFTFVGGGAKLNQIVTFKKSFALDNINIYPYQHRSNLRYSLGACDVSIIAMVPGSEDTIAPSKFYGILASSKPIILIGSSRSDIAQLILHHNCGYVVDCGDCMSLANVILALSSDPQLLEELGSNAYQLYKSKFGKTKSTLQYFNILSR